MGMKLTAAGLILTGAMSIGASGAWGQSYPNKPVRLVTSTVGGGTDFIARLAAPWLSEALGQPVIVENQSSSIIGTELVKKAAPDGYTLLVTGSNLWVASFFQKVPWDPIQDFSPVSLSTIAPSVLVVHPSLPVKSVKELIALAKANPGTLNYGTSGAGSGGHLSGELLKYMAGIDIVRVNYKGGGPLITDVLRGQLHFAFNNANTVRPLISSGKVRALAVTSANPSQTFPDLPTVAATLPGYESVVLNGWVAPAKTPAAILTRLSRENSLLLKRSDVKSKLEASGVEVVGSTPAQYAAMIKADIISMENVAKSGAFKPEEE